MNRFFGLGEVSVFSEYFFCGWFCSKWNVVWVNYLEYVCVVFFIC